MSFLLSVAAKKCCNFWPSQKFQGSHNSWQVIFEWVIWTRGPGGQAQTPKSMFSAKSISSQGFEAGRSYHTFLEREGSVKNIRVEFWFLAHGTSMQGWRGLGGEQNFGISTFFIKGTPSKIRHWSMFVYATFWLDAPLGPQGYPQSQECKIQKSKLGYFL